MKNAMVTVVLIFITFSQSTLAIKAFNAANLKNEKDSALKCPAVCTANGRTWNKASQKAKDSDKSLCLCNDQVNAGPLMKHSEAQEKCPAVCASQYAKWNGQWRTIEEGLMSTCDCVEQ